MVVIVAAVVVVVVVVVNFIFTKIDLIKWLLLYMVY